MSQANKVSHSHRKLEYSLKAAKALGDVDWALEVRDAASEAGKRSVHLDRVLVEILLEAGRPQEARDVLKVGVSENGCCCIDSGLDVPVDVKCLCSCLEMPH